MRLHVQFARFGRVLASLAIPRMTQPLWMLPQGIEEILPPTAARIEALRRSLLDLHARWGYELVYPPIVEHLESLLTGTGHQLDLQTFKLIDPLSGRTLGVHADMTPQVARIDASRLRREGTARMSYVGTVLRTHSNGVGESRSPMQLGAEIFGHSGSASDVEIVSLMLESLRIAGADQLQLDIGHVGVYRTLVNAIALSEAQAATLFDIMQRKSRPELDAYISALDLASAPAAALAALPGLAGGVDVISRARSVLACGGEPVSEALDELQALVDGLMSREASLPILIDLGELRGYHYHTGVVFSAYSEQSLSELARGGRYDAIGAAFGRARPATGFSCDLRRLANLTDTSVPSTRGVLAPHSDDADLLDQVAKLRDAGERVIIAFNEEDDAVTLGCDRELVLRDGAWQTLKI